MKIVAVNKSQEPRVDGKNIVYKCEDWDDKKHHSSTHMRFFIADEDEDEDEDADGFPPKYK